VASARSSSATRSAETSPGPEAPNHFQPSGKTKPASISSPMTLQQPHSSGAIFNQRGQKVGTQYNVSGNAQIKVETSTTEGFPPGKTIKKSQTMRSKKSHETDTGWLEPAHRDHQYVVFCRIFGVQDMSVEWLAGAQKVLMEVCAEAEKNRDFQVLSVHSSVYGRFLCVPHSVQALKTAIQMLDQAVSKGVQLAIGVEVGRLEPVDDFGTKNLIGHPINLAARLIQKLKEILQINPELCNQLDNAIRSRNPGKVKAHDDLIKMLQRLGVNQVLLSISDWLDSRDSRDDLDQIAQVVDGLVALGVDHQWVRAIREQVWNVPVKSGAEMGTKTVPIIPVPRTTEMCSAEIIKSAICDGFSK
jgi:hypothetical protein